MKKLFYTLALVLIVTTASFAQTAGKSGKMQKGTPEQRAEKVVLLMQQKLSLTADQKAKVYQVELNRIIKNDEWQAEGLDKKTNKSERKAFKKANEDQLDAILTVEQKKMVAQIKAEKKNNKDSNNTQDRSVKKGNQTPPPPPTKN